MDIKTQPIVTRRIPSGDATTETEDDPLKWSREYINVYTRSLLHASEKLWVVSRHHIKSDIILAQFNFIDLVWCWGLITLNIDKWSWK